MTAARSVKADTVGVKRGRRCPRGPPRAGRAPATSARPSATCAEDERVTTHLFACTRTGYRGWRWAVTVARAPRLKTVTVDEIVLLPGDDAITAPAVAALPRPHPARRPQPRRPPAHRGGRPAAGARLPHRRPRRRRSSTRTACARWSYELGLGRPRVLSLEGRDLAAERWYDGSHGPDVAAGPVRPRRAARPAGSWSGSPARCPRCSASARTRRPTTTAAWSPGTTAAARTPRRSWPRRASPSRCPSPVLDTLSLGRARDSSEPASVERLPPRCWRRFLRRRQ